MFSPASILAAWLRGFLAIAILTGGIYCAFRWYDRLPSTRLVVRDAATESVATVPLNTFSERFTAWRPRWDATSALLAGALSLGAWSVAGRWVYPRLFRRSGSFDPDTGAKGEVFLLKRPDGTSLHIESFGAKDNPRIILTHGWGLDRRMWHYAIPHLAKRYRVVIWDLPGLGQSMQPEDRDFSLVKMATDLRAVLDATGDQPAVLVGHSIGGMITLTLCKVFPDILKSRIAAISIVHSTYTNPLRTTRFASLLTVIERPVIKPLLGLTIVLSPLLRVLNYLSYMNGSAHRSTARESFAGNETKEELDFASRYTVLASPAVIARGMLGMLEYDVIKALAGIDVPTQIVVGDEDRTTLPEAGEFIHLQIPGSKLSELSPTKHLGFFEQHGRFNQLLGDFADGCFSRRSKHRPSSVASENLMP